MTLTKKQFIERREAVRAKRVLSLQYRLVKSRRQVSDGHWYLSTTHDMSAKGMAFLSEVSYRVGDVLELHTVMSGVIDVIKGYGRVVRVVEKGRQAAFLIAVDFIARPAKKQTKPRPAKKLPPKKR